MKKLEAVFYVLFLGLLLVFVPLAILWALNTLFPVLNIPYSFYTWLAVVTLLVTLRRVPDIKTS